VKDLTEILKLTNSTLAGLEQQLIKGYKAPDHPVIFIVGAPRSGTTLVLQTIINHLNIGYVNNFIAKFWQAPTVGAMLFKSLDLPLPAIDYQSEYGFTTQIHGPHEFGYFWKRFFKYDESHELDPDKLNNIDSNLLLREVASLETAMARPLVFKNPPALSLQIGYLKTTFPKAVFIHCKRKLLHNALSILKGRMQYMNDVNAWFSTKPREYDQLKSKPIPAQIVGQITAINEKIEADLQEIPEQNKLTVPYEEFCLNPSSFVQEIHRLITPDDSGEVRDLHLLESFEIRVPDEVIPGITHKFQREINNLNV